MSKALRCAGVIAVFVLTLVAGVGWAPQASAQNCQGSGSLPIFPISDIGGDADLVAGEGLDITVCIANTSSLNVNPFTPVPAQLGGDTCVANVCNTSGKACPGGTDAECTVEVSVQLACVDGACATTLPGTLTYLGFTDLTGGAIQNCVLDPGDLTNNTVTCTFLGGAANAIALPAVGAPVCFATLDTVATTPVTTVGGVFNKRAEDTGGFDIAITDDVACGAQQPFGAAGTSSCNFPPPCEVQLDRQVSCDNGLNFVDVRDVDDPNNTTVQACSTQNTNPIVVRHVVSNAGDVDLLGCNLVDGNALLGASQVVGNVLIGGDVTVDTPAICQDVVSGEPALATVTCECALIGGNVSDDDVSGLQCTTVTVPAISTWGSALLAGMLLAILSLWTVWMQPARSSR